MDQEIPKQRKEWPKRTNPTILVLPTTRLNQAILIWWDLWKE